MPSSSPRPELATNSCTDMIETHLLVVPWSYYRPPKTEEEETKKICRERRRFEKGEGREGDLKKEKGEKIKIDYLLCFACHHWRGREEVIPDTPCFLVFPRDA
jgi:hypothetical protein